MSKPSKVNIIITYFTYMTEHQSQNVPTTIKTWALRAGLAGLFGGLLTGLSKSGGIVPIAFGFALPIAVVATVLV